MASEQDDWKKKYRELALETEGNAKAAELTIESLKQLVSGMTIALQGDDADLDNELRVLKQTLVDGGARELKPVTQRLGSLIRSRDSRREDNAKRLLISLQKWIADMKAIATQQSSLSDLNELSQSSQSAVDSLYELPDLIARLAECQSGLRISQDQVSDFDLQPGRPSPVDGDTRMLLQNIASELLELIACLYVPQEEKPLARKLVQEVEKGFELADLPDLMRELVTLVGKANNNASEDFERYLINLSEQLTGVQSFLSDSQKEQAAVGQSQRLLDSQVRKDVRALNEAVKTTNEITELKQNVTRQLVGIMRAMDNFKRSEEARESRMQERYEGLMGKVEQMEQETRQVKAHMEEERMKARTDPLTGLPNRAAYDDQIFSESERWARYRAPLSVAVCDLDFFKRINDTYGHLAGDKVLRLIARVLTRSLRSTDFVARYGGEEFVIIMPSTARKEAATALEKLRAAVESSPFNFHGKPVTVTMSFGVTEAKEGDNVDALFSRADALLYQAKENGRNQVCSD
ncbi:GGDEF domain-containing protein [Marinobacterium jannaschii]|uniref:GGDEF domain-containing protein n=1 Tax=Marinobacterium jannaschii TaxID=64970 RepID=UPI0006878137|nr:GGDEF domain-containing protein [Marinobacterium jannaschii]